MKEKRGLSGIYFRFEEEDGKWGNRVFEDLPEEEQDKIMDNKDPEFVKNLAKQLARSLNDIGEQLDLSTE